MLEMVDKKALFFNAFLQTLREAFMKRRGGRLVLVATLVLIGLRVWAASDAVRIDVRSDWDRRLPGYRQTWDPAHDQFILYRNADVSTLPAARVFHGSASVALYPLKDLPEALAITIWSAAATNDGGLVLSATVRYTPQGVRPPVLKPFLLTYDASGNLAKVWNVYPCQPDHIAVDQQGNVFAVGARDIAATNYPLVVKYSPDGKVLREFLPANSFPEGERVAYSSAAFGEGAMFIRGEHLFLWLAPEQKLLRFALSGDLLDTVSLKTALQTLASATGSSRIEVRTLTVTPKPEKPDIIAQVVLWPKDKAQHPSFGMVKISSDSSQIRLMGALSATANPGHFLGISSSGKMVFLENIRADGITVLRQY